MKSLSANINPSQCLITISIKQPHYLINRQTTYLGFVHCDCRQARTSEKMRLITQGSSRCKDGGRGTVVIGVDIRGGVMLWILNVMKRGTTEGCSRCQTVTGSMRCRNGRLC